MDNHLILLFLCYFVKAFSLEYEDHGFAKVTYLEAGDAVHVQQESRRLGFYTANLQIYCYRGKPKSLSRIFQTIQLTLNISNDDFIQYEGPTPKIVQERYDTQTSVFNYILSNRKTQLKLNPFNQTCMGIHTVEDYQIRLHVIQVDIWKVALFLLGLIVFLYAETLSHNSLFYYISGILLGIFASLLVLVYLLSKILPRRPVMYGFVICGWSLVIYLIQIFWENIQVILVSYYNYVLWYVILTGFISFIICYRVGPPENQRSHDLIKWGLQLSSLTMIFYSSEFQEASSAFLIMLILYYCFPRLLVSKFRLYYIRYFPPKPRLLTNEEYYEQGVRETTKALEELRQYASSPECKQWRIVSKLKDPLRFASFVEGSPHVSDQEILEYETSKADTTDSELSEEDDDNNDQRGGTSGVGKRLQLQEQQYYDENYEISEDEGGNDIYNNVRYRWKSNYSSRVDQARILKRK